MNTRSHNLMLKLQRSLSQKESNFYHAVVSEPYKKAVKATAAGREVAQIKWMSKLLVNLKNRSSSSSSNTACKVTSR